MAAPANDNFAAAEVVTLDADGAFTSAPTPSTEATLETGEPTRQPDSPARTIWYAFTPPIGGEVTVDTMQSTAIVSGAVLDTLIVIFTGSDLTALTEITSNDDAPGATSPNYWSQVTFTATAGVTYYVQVGLLYSDRADINYVTAFSMPSAAAPAKSGIGLVLDSSTVSDILPPLGAGGEVVPLHIVAPTVPVPTLVNGRPS